MAFGGGAGAHVDLRKIPMDSSLAADGRTDKALFSESNGRFVVEVTSRARRSFHALLKGLPFALVGQVREAKTVEVVGLDGKTSNWAVKDLESAWRGGFKP
jgi:phosphoribosylformylglycinamidine synthase